jgi:hypothetical protein
LVAITEPFVSPNLEVRKEALHGFLKGDPMLRKLIALEVIFEIRGRESAPIDQTSLYYASSHLAHDRVTRSTCT